MNEGRGEAVGPRVLAGVGMVNFELVIAPDDFVVAINGGVNPSECVDYSINQAGCFVLHQVRGDVVTLPVPAVFRELVEEAQSVVFVRFAGGEAVDGKELTKRCLGRVS